MTSIPRWFKADDSHDYIDKDDAALIEKRMNEILQERNKKRKLLSP